MPQFEFDAPHGNIFEKLSQIGDVIQIFGSLCKFSLCKFKKG